MYTSIIHLKEINDLSLSGILQRFLFSMLSSSDLEEHVKRLKTELKTRMAYLSQATSGTATGPCLWIKTSVPSRICQEDLLQRGQDNAGRYLRVEMVRLYPAVNAHPFPCRFRTGPDHYSALSQRGKRTGAYRILENPRCSPQVRDKKDEYHDCFP